MQIFAFLYIKMLLNAGEVSITDAFTLTAVLWRKSEVSMIGIKFIAYVKYRQIGIESKFKKYRKSL